MKKLIFYSILFLVFLAACNTPFDKENDKQDASLPAPAQNIAKITVYLDENKPPESRAMNRDFAMMGCDYFEVVFVGNKGGTLVTRMGQWKYGDKAGVSDVYRTAGGVNYNDVVPNPSTYDTGSALLLAGKSDKTVMAIGRLAAGSTMITTETKSVTFEVVAVKTGINGDPDLSSFLTAVKSTQRNNEDNVLPQFTNIVSENIMGREFRAFKLETGESAIKAKYTFSLEPSPTRFNNIYQNGFRVAKAGIVEKKHPSYTLPGGGNINVDSDILLDQRTVVTMDNNQTPGIAFDPIVKFTFNTSVAGGTVAGSIFALVFEIPVYALGYNNCLWYIRPGYGVLHYELDYVLGGMGGAVLMKTGDVPIPTISTDFIIRIKTPPNKWRYRWSSDITGGYHSPNNPSGETPAGTAPIHAEYDRVFRYTGLVVELLHASSPYDPIMTNTLAPGGIIDNTALRFYIGKDRILPNHSSGNYVLPNEFYGIIEIIVRFTDPKSNISADDKFYILASGDHERTRWFDYANPADISSRIFDVPKVNNDPTTYNFVDIKNDIANGNKNRITIVRLTGSVTMNDTIQLNLDTHNNNGNDKDKLFDEATLIIFVASAQNITLGRGGNGTTGNRIEFTGQGSSLAGLYFGKWPFDGLARSPSILNSPAAPPPPATPTYATYPFTINVVGPHSGTANPPIINKFITDSTGNGGMFNVIVGDGMNIIPQNTNVFR